MIRALADNLKNEASIAYCALEPRVFSVDNLAALESPRVSQVLAKVQETYTLVARRPQGVQNPNEMLASCDSGHGIHAYRPPTMEECSDEQRLRKYVRHSEIHKYKMHLFNLSTHLATLEAYVRREGESDESRRIRRSRERLRRRSIENKALPEPQLAPVPEGTRLVGDEGRPLPPDLREP